MFASCAQHFVDKYLYAEERAALERKYNEIDGKLSRFIATNLEDITIKSVKMALQTRDPNVINGILEMKIKCYPNLGFFKNKPQPIKILLEDIQLEVKKMQSSK